MTDELQTLWLISLAVLAFILFAGFGAKALLRRLRMLRHSARVRAEATRVIEHNALLFCQDVRRPYATILSLLDAMQRETDPAARERLVAGLAQDTRLSLGKVDAMIADVLELGQDRPLASESLEPAALIEQALRRLSSAGANVLGLSVQLRSVHTRKLRGDAVRLVTALVQVLDNAAAAAGPAGRLWLECRDVERGNTPYIAICIGNSGSYIPDGIRELIFEPFCSLNKPGAAGLGLTLVRRIVERHGGRIEVRSEPERGTEFIMTLPAAMSPSRYRPQCSVHATLQTLVDVLTPAWPVVQGNRA